MLKVLLKKQFFEVFKGYFFDAKKNKARSKGATIGWFIFFIVLMVVILGGSFTAAAIGIGIGLQGQQVDWLYCMIFGCLAVIFGVFGSAFNTYSGLYLAKDNDLLLSMPIPVRTIMFVRLITVYLLGALYSGVVIVPAMLVYFILFRFDVVSVIAGLLFTIGITVIDWILSCLLGFVIAKISLRLKRKSIITVFISILGIGLYYFGYFKAQVLLQQIAEKAQTYAASVKKSAYVLYVFGAAGTGELLPMLFLLVAIVLAAGLTWLLLSKTFLGIATATGAVEKKVYREKKVRGKSASAALLQKELSRFFGSANYMLNCGLGILILPAGGVAMLIKGKDLSGAVTGTLPLYQGIVPVMMAGMICLLSTMNDMAAPSVSLEGKNLWILQSLPVHPWQCLQAKLRLQLLLTMPPALIAGVLCTFSVPGDIITKIMMVLMPLAFILFMALFGLFLGVKMPNLNWTSEINPIKQSGNVAIAIFGGWAVAILAAGLYFVLGLFMHPALYLLLISVLFLIPAFFLYRWMKTKSAAEFAAL